MVYVMNLKTATCNISSYHRLAFSYSTDDTRRMITTSTRPILDSSQHLEKRELDGNLGLSIDEEDVEKPAEEIILLPVSSRSTNGTGSQMISINCEEMMDVSGHRSIEEEQSSGMSSGLSSLDASITGLQSSQNQLDDPVENEQIESPMSRSIISGHSALKIMKIGDKFKSKTKSMSRDTSFSNNSLDNSINLKKVYNYRSAGEITATTEEGTSSFAYSQKNTTLHFSSERERSNTPVSPTLSSSLRSFNDRQRNHNINTPTTTHSSNTNTWATSFDNNDSFHGMISLSSNESSTWRNSRKNKNNRKLDRKKQLKEKNRNDKNPLPEVVHTIVTNRGGPSKQAYSKSSFNEDSSSHFQQFSNRNVTLNSPKYCQYNQRSHPNFSQQSNPLQVLNSSSNFVRPNFSEKAQYQMFLEQKCQYQQQQYYPQNKNLQQFNEQPMHQYPPNNFYHKKSPQVIIPQNHRKHQDSSSSINDPHSQFAPQAVPKLTTQIDYTLDRNSTKINFSTVEIRFYRRTLGDNPSCSNGPPVGIDWEYDQNNVVQLPLNEFERLRSARLEGHDLVLCREEREEILETIGYSRLQIAQAVRTNIRIKNQRRQTINNLAVMKVEEAIEKASRKMKKMILGKGRKKKKKMLDGLASNENARSTSNSSASSCCEESKSSCVSNSALSQLEDYKKYSAQSCTKSILKRNKLTNSV